MKTGYSFILSVLFVLLLVNPVIGSDWVKYWRYKENIYFYNRVSVKHIKEDIVQVWGKVVFSDEAREKDIQGMRKWGLSTEGYDKLSHTLDLYEIDCKNQRYQFLSVTHYDTDGSVIKGLSYDKPDWTHILPNSIMDNLRKKVCVTKKKPLKKK